MKRKGFTLLELLIVLVVVTMLAALLVPVFSQARARARKTHCINNLRELARAVAMYAKDYDGCAPGVGYPSADQEWAGSWPRNPYVSWQTALAPYVRSRALFNCPDAAWTNTVVGTVGAEDMFCFNVPFPDSWQGAKLSYAFNVMLQLSERLNRVDPFMMTNTWFNAYPMASHEPGVTPATGWGGHNYSLLQQPNQVVMIADANNPTEFCGDKLNITEFCPSVEDPGCDEVGSPNQQGGDNYAVTARHNSGNNWAYADGRVKWVPAGKYTCGGSSGWMETDAVINTGDTLQKAHGIDQLN